MAGYSYTGQVTDPNAKKAIINALDLIASLTARVQALEAAALLNSTTINANDQRIASLAAPSADSDAANVTYVRAYVAAQLEGFKRGLTATVATGTTPTLVVANGLIQSVS